MPPRSTPWTDKQNRFLNENQFLVETWRNTEANLPFVLREAGNDPIPYLFHAPRLSYLRPAPVCFYVAGRALHQHCFQGPKRKGPQGSGHTGFNNLHVNSKLCILQRFQAVQFIAAVQAMQRVQCLGGTLTAGPMSRRSLDKKNGVSSGNHP